MEFGVTVITHIGKSPEQIRLAEEYLAPFGRVTRDKVMFKNALLFYRRHVLGADEDEQDN